MGSSTEHSAYGPTPQPVGPRPDPRRLRRRLRARRRVVPGAARDRHRHRRLDPAAGRRHRHGRRQADLRRRLPLRPGRAGVAASTRPDRAPARCWTPRCCTRSSAATTRWTRPRSTRRCPPVVERGAAGADVDGLRVGVVQRARRRGLPGRRARAVRRGGRSCSSTPAPRSSRSPARASTTRSPPTTSSCRARRRATSPSSTRCGTACASAPDGDPQRRAGHGRHPRRRLRRRGQAPHHPRHVRPVVRLLRRLLRPGAEGPHADRRDFAARVRAGRRARLADRADHGVPDRRASSTTRWRCTSTTSPRSRPTSPACRACRCRAGWPTRTACRPASRSSLPRAGRPALRGSAPRWRPLLLDRWGGPAARPRPRAVRREPETTIDRGAREAVRPYEDAVAAYDPVLGLEVHVELDTATKMFCGCADGVRGRAEHAGLPGLPRAARRAAGRQRGAVESAIRIGLALNCQIAEWCRFARKNYFYPDMPKNFQTSQYDEPIAFDGYLDVELEDGSRTGSRSSAPTWRRTPASRCTSAAPTGRIHGADHSLVDYNRAGIPLIEIVTKPMTGAGDRAPEVARAYVTALRDLLRALEVSDVRMEQGSLRCDANVSLRPRRRRPGRCRSAPGPRPRTSTRCAPSSGRCGTRSPGRPRSCTTGGRIVQETRHWHEDTGVTTSGPGEVATPRTTGTSRSPTWCPSRRRPSGSRSCGRRCPSRPARGAAAADRLGLHRSRDARRRQRRRGRAHRGHGGRRCDGRRPRASGGCGEVARRANADGVDVGEYAAWPGLTPAHVAELDGAGRPPGASTTRWRGRCSTACWPARARPTAVADARGLELVSDDGAARGGRRRGDRGEPGRRGEDPRRQGRRRPARSSVGHEGDAGSGRRREGPRDPPGETDPLTASGSRLSTRRFVTVRARCNLRARARTCAPSGAGGG